MGLQWVSATGSMFDYKPNTCIDPVAIIVRVERGAPKPAAFSVEGYTYSTADGEPAWEVLVERSSLTWPVPMLKVPVPGSVLPLPGPQPSINTTSLPLEDFNVTRSQSGSYLLPPGLVQPAAPGIVGLMWYARLTDSGAELPSWLRVDPFSGDVSAFNAGYDGTELETAVTRVTPPFPPPAAVIQASVYASYPRYSQPHAECYTATE